MCNKSDNSCREEKLGCNGCFYNIDSYSNYTRRLYNLNRNLFNYVISEDGLLFLYDKIQKIIFTNYIFNRIEFKFDNKETIICSIKNFLTIKFNIGRVIDEILNNSQNYILTEVNNEIIKYYKR